MSTDRSYGNTYYPDPLPLRTEAQVEAERKKLVADTAKFLTEGSNVEVIEYDEVAIKEKLAGEIRPLLRKNKMRAF